jgi:prepilin-type N-terminal cleavage/methylation domain-containing protein
MNKLNQNEQGFSAVELIMVIVIIVLIGAVGYFVYKNDHQTTRVVTITKTQQATPKTSSTTNSTSYLVIKEWGVKIALTSPLTGATYKIVTNNQYQNPSAYLSTTTLDASADCVSYYAQGATANSSNPSFQYIERFSLTDTTYLSEGAPGITAQQAVQQSPDTYKQVDNYVYRFGHGNGEPCSEQASTIEPAFQSAFNTIKAN